MSLDADVGSLSPGLALEQAKTAATAKIIPGFMPENEENLLYLVNRMRSRGWPYFYT